MTSEGVFIDISSLVLAANFLTTSPTTWLCDTGAIISAIDGNSLQSWYRFQGHSKSSKFKGLSTSHTMARSFFKSTQPQGKGISSFQTFY